MVFTIARWDQVGMDAICVVDVDGGSRQTNTDRRNYKFAPGSFWRSNRIFYVVVSLTSFRKIPKTLLAH